MLAKDHQPLPHPSGKTDGGAQLRKAKADRDRLAAECAELRKALEKIVSVAGDLDEAWSHRSGSEMTRDSIGRLNDMARAALSQAKG